MLRLLTFEAGSEFLFLSSTRNCEICLQSTGRLVITNRVWTLLYTLACLTVESKGLFVTHCRVVER